MSAQPVLPQPTGTITLTTSDAAELVVDKEMLCYCSKFFQDMLSSCDTGRIQLDETKESLELILDVMKGNAPSGTFDTRSSGCWEVYKKIMLVADKYDMAIVRERCEKWLVSRCLRGKVRCEDFKFQDVGLGLEWLLLCQKYGLRDLGWYCAYDLGCQLADNALPQPVSEFVKEINDPEFLKTMLEAVSDTVAEHNETSSMMGSQGGD